MAAALVATIMSLVELVELWGGFTTGIHQQWVETTLMILTPILVFFAPGWQWVGKLFGRSS